MATDEVPPFDLARLASEARARLPGIADGVELLARTVDPFELLAQLTLLYQTHAADQQPNRDEMARWQVKIEWLAWLLCSRHVTVPPTPALIDARVLEPLGKAHAAPLHSCKYRWLHAPATIDTCSERAPASRVLLLCTVAPSIAARFPFSSILSIPWAGVIAAFSASTVVEAMWRILLNDRSPSALVGTTVRVRGVGFYDLAHRQRGRSANCMELHPIRLPSALCLSESNLILSWGTAPTDVVLISTTAGRRDLDR